jgi:hypothetical protein
LLLCLSEQAVDTCKGKKAVYAITAATLKWQPHTSDVLTEGAFTFTTLRVQPTMCSA